MKTALTIAGYDPTSSAGISLDLKVFHHFGVYGISVLTALTAQNTFEIKDIKAIDKKFLEEQLYTILSDIRPDALKTGMLFSKDAVKVVAKVVKGFDLKNLVIDPVTVSTTGTKLLEDGALDLVMNELFPLAKVITPNIYEASVLSGIRIEDRNDMQRAAEALKKTGVENVIITGGHFKEPSSHLEGRDDMLDLLYDGLSCKYFKEIRIDGEYHGTGCAFSAAITALLAMDVSVPASIAKAKKFISASIKNAHELGRGMKLLNIYV